jgi:cytochrome c556
MEKQPNEGVKLGIVETKEALTGILELSLVMVSQFKDGIQATDLAELWAKWQTDEKFKEAMQKAFDGVKKVPAELKDIDLTEGVNLAMLTVGYVPKFVAAFSKKDPAA